MDRQRKLRVIIAAAVAAVVIVAALGGTTTVLLERAHQRGEDVAAADRAAASFNQRVSQYRSDVKIAIENADLSDAVHLQAGIESAVDVTPKLGDATPWGRVHSKAYTKARAAERTLKKPYRELTSVLAEAVVGQPFIAAGLKALNVNVNDFVKERLLPNGSRIRSEAIPGFRKALTRFNKVKVPHGQAAVAAKVRKELQETISEAAQVANSLDVGRGGLIFAKKEYLSASKALLAYDKSLRERIGDAADKVTGEVNDDQSAA